MPTTGQVSAIVWTKTNGCAYQLNIGGEFRAVVRDIDATDGPNLWWAEIPSEASRHPTILGPWPSLIDAMKRAEELTAEG